MLPIKWNEQRVPITTLVLNKNNPRRISKSQFEKLKASLKETGYHHRILITPLFEVIGGHQRIRALRELGVQNVEVLQADRDLSPEEYKRILVQDNLSFGEFDMDILANDFMPRDLIEWGFPDFKTDLLPVAPAEPAESEKQQNVKDQSHKCPSCGYSF